MAKKRQRVPEVLWRMFSKRARSLAETILALVGKCQCKRRRCLSCSGDQAMSFLLRPDDPSDYRRLLTESFAVVTENAPPLPTFDPHRRWPQNEIVRRTIEMIVYEQPSSQNLLCNSYDKENRSSALVDAVTSSAWILLLRRIGDALMMYLLKYTSLFLPLPRNKHYHQITGFPVSELCVKSSKRLSDSKTQHQPLEDHGLTRKRKKAEGVVSTSGKHLYANSLASEPSLKSASSLGSKSGSSCVCNEEILLKESTESSKQDSILARKHKRQYRWQRQRKRRRLAIQECSLNPNSGNRSSNDELSRGLQDGFSRGSCQSNGTFESDFSCFGLQNVLNMSGNAEIHRRNIFYMLESSTSMLPRKHILYTLKPNDSGVIILFKNIFGIFGNDDNPQSVPCLCSKSTGCTRSTCLYQSLVKLLKGLIRKTQNCRHLRLLNKHCSILSSSYCGADRGDGPVFEDIDSGTKLSINAENGNMIPEATIDQVEPSKSYCPKKYVVSFIWAICRRIVPSPLLGEPSNWRILRRNISKFIHLRRFEKFSLKECMHKLKLSKFPLLSNIQCRGLQNEGSENGFPDIVRHAILEHWMFWFFAHLVSPLVEANFYVTDSEHGKQEVLYYLKSTWENIMREAEQDQRYHQLNFTDLRKILRNRSFGFSKARLRPKQAGFRVLANLQAPSRIRVKSPSSRIHSCQQQSRMIKAFSNSRGVKYNFFKSVNNVLQDMHVVLKALHKKEPEKMGSSVFGHNDVYRKLVPFLLCLRNGSTTPPGVFIVVSDVSKAFDSVIQDKLLSVMKDVLLDDEYTLEKFIQVIPTKESLKVHQHLTLAHQESANIRSTFAQDSVEGILVKKASSRTIKREDLDMLLKEHITRNVVQLRSNFYLQRVGIPQGSVLSTLLCSYYYGCMERNIVFPFLEKACEDILGENDTNRDEAMLAHAPKYLLLRFVDDYMFISTSKKQASMFFSRLERGVREYNCCMNKEKYGLNFNMNHGEGSHSSRLHVGKDGLSFLRWSGLLVNCSTLEIQADYTRYLNSHLSSTLTVSCKGELGRLLKEKLCDYLQPKCHPIFYDSNINSAGVVRLNIYQVFLLCAMKFICYISRLSTMPSFSPEFCLNAIVASLRYMKRLIKRRMYSLGARIEFRPKYGVKKKEIEWLGLYAYARVLEKKQSRHKELLRLFVSQLKAYEKVENMPSELKYAVDDAHSSVLWNIKY